MAYPCGYQNTFSEKNTMIVADKPTNPQRARKLLTSQILSRASVTSAKMYTTIGGEVARCVKSPVESCGKTPLRIYRFVAVQARSLSRFVGMMMNVLFPRRRDNPTAPGSPSPGHFLGFSGDRPTAHPHPRGCNFFFSNSGLRPLSFSGRGVGVRGHYGIQGLLSDS